MAQTEMHSYAMINEFWLRNVFGTYEWHTAPQHEYAQWDIIRFVHLISFLKGDLHKHSWTTYLLYIPNHAHHVAGRFGCSQRIFGVYCAGCAWSCTSQGSSLNVHQLFAFNTSRSMRTHKWHTACVRTYVAPWRSRAVFFTALLCYSFLRFLPSPLQSIGGKMRCVRSWFACTFNWHRILLFTPFFRTCEWHKPTVPTIISMCMCHSNWRVRACH